MTFLFEKIRMRRFFTTKFENFKKAIFEDQKVIYGESSDSSVVIGVWYIQGDQSHCPPLKIHDPAYVAHNVVKF